jgi:hypothetical protein
MYWSLATEVGKNRERVDGRNNSDGEGTGGGVVSSGEGVSAGLRTCLALPGDWGGIGEDDKTITFAAVVIVASRVSRCSLGL